MAKKGMSRPERGHAKNNVPPVPELQGKAKHSKEPANPIIAGTSSPDLKVWHDTPFSAKKGGYDSERPISEVYGEIDSDLARDNLENDLTAADLQDM